MPAFLFNFVRHRRGQIIGGGAAYRLVFEAADAVERGFLQRAPLRRLVEEERSGREDRSKQIWQLLTLELWCRQAAAAGVTT